MARILLIEDNADLAEFVARGLSVEGYEADILVDGTDAMRNISEYDYALVILDRRLPTGRVCGGLR